MVVEFWTLCEDNFVYIKVYRLFSHNVVTMETSAIGWPPWLITLFWYLQISEHFVTCSCSAMVPSDPELSKCSQSRWPSSCTGFPRSLRFEKLVHWSKRPLNKPKVYTTLNIVRATVARWSHLLHHVRVCVIIDIQPMSSSWRPTQVYAFLWHTLLVKTSTHGADEDVLHRRRVGDLVLKLWEKRREVVRGSILVNTS